MDTVIQVRCSKEFKSYFEEKKKKLGYERLSNERFIEKAINTLYDLEYMDKEASILNDHILRAIDSSNRQVESRLGNRICKLLSEICIQLFIVVTILKETKYLTNDEIKKIRKEAVTNMKDNDGLINYKDIDSRRWLNDRDN